MACFFAQVTIPPPGKNTNNRKSSVLCDFVDFAICTTKLREPHRRRKYRKKTRKRVKWMPSEGKRERRRGKGLGEEEGNRGREKEKMRGGGREARERGRGRGRGRGRRRGHRRGRGCGCRRWCVRGRCRRLAYTHSTGLSQFSVNVDDSINLMSLDTVTCKKNAHRLLSNIYFAYNFWTDESTNKK